LIEANY